MGILLYAIVAVLIALSPAPSYLESRYHGIRLFLRDSATLPSVNTFNKYEILFTKQIRNCEDVEIVESGGFALLSCDPGRDRWNTVMGTFIDPNHPGSIYYYPYAASPSYIERLSLIGYPASNATTFHPLGMVYHEESQTLTVINHSPAGSSLELFHLDPDPSSPTLTHKRTYVHPYIRTPNAIVALSPTRYLLTNDHHFRAVDNKPLALLESLLAFPGGSVVYVDIETDEAEKLAFVPFANGIVFLNESTLAVAACSRPEVRLYNVTWLYNNDGSKKPVHLHQISTIPTPHFVDNLSVDSEGRLLIAGHPDFAALIKVVKSNWQYHTIDEESEARVDEVKSLPPQPRSPSWIQQWQDGALADLYVGMEYGMSSTAARDAKRGVGIVVGLYEKGLILWRD